MSLESGLAEGAEVEASGELAPPPLEAAGGATAARALDQLELVEREAQPAHSSGPPSGPASESRAGLARDLVRLCEAQLEQGGDPSRLARLHYEAARLLEVPLWDFGAAAMHYEEARKVWPDHLPTLRGLRRVQTALGNYTALPALIDSEIRATREPARRAQLLYEKGCVHRDFLADHREARASFAAAVELQPTDLTLLRAARLAELSAKGWARLDKTYEAMTHALAEDAHHQAAILVERARLVDVQLGDPPLAAALYETALSVDGQVARAVRELKRLLYRQQRWLHLAQLLAQEAMQTDGRVEQASLLAEAAGLYGARLGDWDAATRLWEQAHERDPANLVTLEELALCHERAGRHSELAAVLEKIVACSISPSDKLHRLYRLAELYAESLNDLERAVHRHEAVLQLDPGFAPSLLALERLYRQSENWSSLIEMYRGEAASAETSLGRADALVRVAQVAEEESSDTDLAISAYQEALAVLPSESRAFKALVRLFLQAGEHTRLAELYRREVDRVEDTQTKRTYLFKLGRLQEDLLGTPQHALATYREVLALEPTNTEALHAAQRTAERAEMWPELAEALEAEVAVVREVAAQLRLWHRLGEVHELKLGDPPTGQTWYRKVLRRDDSHAPTLRSLARLYSNTGRHADLLSIYQLQLKSLSKPAAKAELLFKMGQLCERLLANEEEALSNYRKAIQFDPGHIPSLRSLQGLLSERGEWKELVRLVQTEAAAHTDPATQVRARHRVGEIYEHRLSAPDLALEAYEHALQLDAGFRPAIEARTRLLELSKSHEALSQDLEREAQAAPSARAKVDALLGHAQVVHHRLDSPGGAVKLYEAALAEDPHVPGALLALEELYVSLGRFEDLANIYQRQASSFQIPAGKVAALRELGRVQETQRLCEGADVAKTYLSIVRHSPTDAEVLTTVERLAIAQQDWALVQQVDGQLAQYSSDPALVAAHQVRLGEAYETEGKGEALGAFRNALAQDPESLAATRGLSRLAARSEDPDLLAEAAEYEARVIRNLDGAARLLTRAASLRSEPEQAARDLERALDIHPDHQGAADALVEALSSSQQFERLIATLTHAAGAARLPERRADLRIELAKVHLQNQNDPGAAIAAAQRAVKERPKYARALLTLGNLYAGVRQWREAVRWLREALDAEPAPSLATWARLELARILAQRLSDPAGAVELLQKVLESDDHNRDALQQLIAAQTALGLTDEAAQTAALLVDAGESDEERARAHLSVAHLESGRGDRDAALGAYQQAVALIGLEGSAADEFKHFLVMLENAGEKAPWALYGEALSEYLAEHKLRAGRSGQVHLELARVVADKLGDNVKALTVLRQGIAATQDNELLRYELAQRLRNAGEHERAADEYHLLLAQSPLQPVYWRELSGAYKALGRDEQSRLALGPLVTLNHADQLEQATYGMRPPRPEAAGAAAFDAPAYRAVDVHSPDDLATTQLIASLCTAAHKLYASDFTTYGVSPKDRLGSRSSHPVRVLADRVGAVLGVEEFDVYVHRAPLRRVDIELTETPALFVPEQVAGLSESLQTFLLARAMCSLARKTYVAEKLQVKALRYLIAAAIRHVDSSYTVDFVDQETLQTESRRVVKALAWRSRKTMEEAARAYLAGSQSPLMDWRFRERVTAVRVASVLCDDLAGATAVLLQSEMDLAEEDTGQPQGAELPAAVLGFAVSDSAMQLRRRLGLLMK